MIKKLITTFIASVIFALIMAAWSYVPVDEQVENVYYEPFYGLFIIFAIYSLPVYLLGGVINGDKIPNNSGLKFPKNNR